MHTFNDHTILVITGVDRLIDPTIQQFREVPPTKQGMLQALPYQRHGHFAHRIRAGPVLCGPGSRVGQGRSAGLSPAGRPCSVCTEPKNVHRQPRRRHRV